ncbi:MAG: bestrophin family ion channel, partial [Waterburya sp.]
MKFSSKKSASLKTWKQKFYIHTGERLNWFQIILRLQGSILLNIIPWVTFFAGYSLIIVLLDHHEKHLPLPKITAGIPNIILSLNLILSLLLVFRLNAAYDRYWEGRKLWGALVNSVRNLTRGIVIVVETSSQLDRLEKEETVRLTVAFAVAMKLHLRSQPVDKQLIVLISSSRYSKLQNTNHLPLIIALWIGEYLQDQYRHKFIDVYQLTTLQNLLDELVNILGGCERILKTP